MHPGPTSYPGEGGNPQGGHGSGNPPRPPQQPPGAPEPYGGPGVYEAPTQEYGGYGSPSPYGSPAAPPAPVYSPTGTPGAEPGYPPQPQFGAASVGPGGSGPGYLPGSGPGSAGGPGSRAASRGTRTPAGRPQYAVLRGIVAFLCLLLTVSLTVPAITTSWLKAELISDSGFADNAAELIEKPAVRDEIQSRIANDVMVKAGLPDNTRGMVVQAVGQVMTTDEFRRAWREGAAIAHNIVVSTLLGKDSTVTDVQGNSLTIKVATPLDPLLRELTTAGVKVDRGRLPQEIPVSLADIPEKGAVQDALKGIDDAGWMLPVLAIALLLVGVGVAVHRLRALALVSMGTLVASGVLLVAANLARSPVVDEASKSSTLSSDATGAVYDVFTDSLVAYSWTVVVISLVGLAGAGIAGAVLRQRRSAY